MTLRERGKKVQQQILRDVKYHPHDIVQHIGEIFSISRQAVHKHIKKLVAEDWIETSGETRNKIYKLGTKREHRIFISINKSISEHDIYNREFHWVIDGLPKNVEDIIYYGFTEMLNNVIDHSECTDCSIIIIRNIQEVSISICDNGEGIFKRITRLKKLSDEKQAILELYKGKLTTDPTNHSGQGIFFTSKMFDIFSIFSKKLVFQHQIESKHNYILDDKNELGKDGTAVFMNISATSRRIDNEVFNKYSGNEEENYAFNRTVIPVNMARMEQENLVSRSQAKRLLARIEKFKYVELDFKNVDSIGQAFADEIFRVYRLKHPKILITSINTSDRVSRMITRTIAEI